MVILRQSSARLKQRQSSAQSRHSSSRVINRPIPNLASRNPIFKLSQQSSQEVNNFVNRINQATTIQQVNSILANAPEYLKSYALQIKAQIERNKQDIIGKLEKDIKKAQEKYKRAKKEKKKAERGTNNYANIKADQVRYSTEVSQGRKFLSQIRSGKLMDYNSMKNFVRELGRYERKVKYNDLNDANKYAQAKAKAQKETIAKLRKEGFTPTMNIRGELIGYSSGRASGFQEYRFTNKGGSQFYKSHTIKPIMRNNQIIGYNDTKLKMNIGRHEIERHLSRQAVNFKPLTKGGAYNKPGAVAQNKKNNFVTKMVAKNKRRTDLVVGVGKGLYNAGKKVNNYMKIKGDDLVLKASKKELIKLKELRSKKNLSWREKNLRDNLEWKAKGGKAKLVRFEIDLGGRAIGAKLLAKLPEYAKIFKGSKDFGKLGGKNVINKITQLTKLRSGQTAQAYLKAKNAQLGDKTMGGFVSMGGKAPVQATRELNNKLRLLKIKPSEVTLSRYAQSFSVPSNIPKTEALIKMLKTGKPLTKSQVKNIPNNYIFKREGIMATKQLKNGNVKVIAMEYNRIGGRLSHISYKSAVGSDKYSVVSTFKKVRKSSVKHTIQKKSKTRVKHTGTHVIKSKIIKKEMLGDEVEMTLSQLKSKKVFFNGKRMKRSEIVEFQQILKSTNDIARNKRMGNMVKKMYKASPKSNANSVANVVRVERKANAIIIKSGNKKRRTLGVSKKGDFLEIGFAKKRIASNPKPKVMVVGKIKKSAVVIKKVPKTKPRNDVGTQKIRKELDNAIKVTRRSIPSPSLSRLQLKRGATITQKRNVENAVKSIQTIVRPISRSAGGKITPKRASAINSQIRKILPAVSIANKKALSSLARSVSMVKDLNMVSSVKEVAKAETQGQKKATRQIQKAITSKLSAMRPPKSPTGTPSIAIRTRIPPRTPTPKTPRKPKIPKRKKAKMFKPKAVKKSSGFNSYYKKGSSYGNINRVPVTRSRALDIVAYAMIKNKLSKGIISKDVRKLPLETLKRKVGNAPVGFFGRNRSKLLVRKRKTKVESYEIVLKSSIKKVAKKKPKRKRVVKKVRRKTTRRRIRRK